MLKIVKNLWALRAPPRTQLGSSQRSPRPVMWSEIVGLRTRPVCDQKIGLDLDLGLQVLCHVVKYTLVTLIVIMILEDTAAFQVLV